MRRWSRKARLVAADRNATATQTLFTTVVEKYLRILNMSNLEVDGLQQQKTTSDCTPVSQQPKLEALASISVVAWSDDS